MELRQELPDLHRHGLQLLLVLGLSEVQVRHIAPQLHAGAHARDQEVLRVLIGLTLELDRTVRKGQAWITHKSPEKGRIPKRSVFSVVD